MNMRVSDTPGQNPVQDILDNSVVEQAKKAKLMGDPSVTVDGARGSKAGAAPLTLHDLLPPPDTGSLQRVATASQNPVGSTGVTEGSTQTTSTNPYQQKLGPDEAVDATAGLMAAMRAAITQQNMSAEDDENTRESNLNAYEGQMKSSIKQIDDQASDIWKAALTNGICGFAAGAMSIGGSMAGAAGFSSESTIDPDDPELTNALGQDSTDMDTNIDDQLEDEDDISKTTGQSDDEEDPGDEEESLSTSSQNSVEDDIETSARENEQSSENTRKTESEEEQKSDEKTDAQKKTEAIDKNTKAREEQMKESQRSQKWQQRQMRLQGLSQMIGSGGQAGGAGFTSAQTTHTGEEKQDEAQAQQLLTASQNENEFKQTNRSNINQTIQSMGSVLSTLADAKLTTAKA